MAGTRNNQRLQAGWSALAAPLLLFAAFAVVVLGGMPFLPASGAWLRPTFALVLILAGLACSRRHFSQVRTLKSVWAALAFLGLLLVFWLVQGQRTLGWFGNPDTPQLSTSLLIVSIGVILLLLLAQKHRLVDALPVFLTAGLTVWSTVAFVLSFFPSTFFSFLQLFQTTPTTLAVLAVMAALVLLAVLIFKPLPLLWRIAATVAVAGNILLLLRMDRPLAWGLLGLGTVAVLVIAVRRFQDVSVRTTVAAFALCALALVATFLRLPEPIRAQVPAEVGIQHRLTIQIVTKAISAHPGGLVWGFGPDSFVRLFAAYRGPAWNQTPLWNVRFAEPSSLGWQFVVGWGPLASLVATVFVAWATMISAQVALAGQWRGTRKAFVRRAGYGSDMQPTAVGVVAALVVGVIAILLSSVGASVLLLVAMLAGWSLRQGATPEGSTDSQRARMIGLWVVVACFLAAVACGAVAVRAAQAEYKLQQALTNRDAASWSQGLPWLMDQAQRSTDARLLRLATWARLRSAHATDIDEAARAQAYAESVLAAQRAVSVSNDIRTLDQGIVTLMEARAAGAQTPELETWVAQAHAAEPDSPVWPFVVGTLVDVSDPANAEAAYREAYAFKPDYVPNTRALALLLERTERGEEGLALLESLRVALPYDDAVILALSAMLLRRNAEGDVARVAALLKAQGDRPNASDVLKREYRSFLNMIGAASSTPPVAP